VLNDSSAGVTEEQVLYAALWSDGDVSIVTQSVEHPIGPDVQRPAVLTTRVDFLEWVASTFNVAIYDVHADVAQVDTVGMEDFASLDVIIEQRDVGYHAR
jgi:hypothetical protein